MWSTEHTLVSPNKNSQNDSVGCLELANNFRLLETHAFKSVIDKLQNTQTL